MPLATSIRLMTLVALLASLTFASRASAEDFDVYIMIGQSNMDGRAHVDDLTGPLAKFANRQPDVTIDYSSSDIRGPIESSGGWKTLCPGWSVAAIHHDPDFEMPSHTFGPEVSFGRAIADATPAHHVAIIKFAEGGTSLHFDWSPDIHNRLWDESQAFVRRALDELPAKGDRFNIKAIIWHQGESDTGLPAGKYAELLTAFITKWRDELKIADLPFVIGELYDNHHRDDVRQDERDVSRSMQYVYFASSAGLNTLDRGTHFDARSQIEMGQRMAAALLGKTPATGSITPSTEPSDATFDTTEAPTTRP